MWAVSFIISTLGQTVSKLLYPNFISMQLILQEAFIAVVLSSPILSSHFVMH